MAATYEDRKEYYKQYYKDNKVRILKTVKEYQIKNQEKYKHYSKKYEETNRERRRLQQRNNRYLRMFGISAVEYDEIFKSQNYSCKICKTTEADFNLDHNHKTNKIRGILCKTCNMALGLFYDNIEILEASIKYLKEVPYHS